MIELDFKCNPRNQTENSFTWSTPIKKVSDFNFKASREGHPLQHLENYLGFNYPISTWFLHLGEISLVLNPNLNTEDPIHYSVEVMTFLPITFQ